MTVKVATDASFEQEVLASELPVLVDFWAEWCGPCRALGPILDELSREHAAELAVVKVNVDENPGVAERYRITSIPAMKVFQGGEVVRSLVGAKPKAVLEAELEGFISS